jgi:hypothetical protein
MRAFGFPRPSKVIIRPRSTELSADEQRHQNLERLYTLYAPESIDDALDFLYDILDDLLMREKYGECNHYLRDINLERLRGEILVGILTVTFSARAHLNERAAVFTRIRTKLGAEMPQAEVEATLRGLEG